MIKEFNFRFNELAIDQKKIGAILGYGNDELPQPFDSYLEEALKEASNLPDIRACYRIIDAMAFEANGNTIHGGGHKFKIGEALFKELHGTERLAFFICTAGKTISDKSVNLLKGKDPVLGYIYDILGTIITESAGDFIQSFLKQEIEKNGELITNRYSPGYCHWHVSDQHKLFSLFQENICGVTLTDSALMHPIKSISGLIGIGKHVKFGEYECTLCSSKDCIYRKIKNGLQVSLD